MAETITIHLSTVAQTAGIRATVDGLQNLQNTTQRLDGWLKRTAGSIAAMAVSAVGITAVGAAFKGAIERGVRFNSTVEDARLGIAAILKQFNPQAFANFEDALGAAGVALDLLKKKAVESPASFGQLVSAFQAITGAATGARIKLQDQVDLVVLMSQALAGLGIRSEQIIQESRALITGNINEDAMAARILGIRKADIEAAKEQGQLYEFLRSRLSAFAEAGAAGTRNLSVAFSNLGDVVEQKLAQITLPIFEAIKAGVLALGEEVNKADLQEGLGSIANRIKFIVDLTFDLARFGVRNVELFTTAIKSLTVAVGLLATRAAFTFGSAVFTKGAGALAWFSAVNKTVANVSRYSGALMGVVTAVSTLTGFVSILGAAFAGWNLGRVIGRMELFGVTIDNFVTYHILKALEAWEQFKLSVGAGSEEMLAGVQQSIQDILVPPPKSTESSKGLPDPDEKELPLVPVDALTNQRMLLEAEAVRIQQIENDMTISAAQRNDELQAIYVQRHEMLEQLKKDVEDQYRSSIVATPETGARFTEEYAKHAQELNQILAEQARLLKLIYDTNSQETFFNSFVDGMKKLAEEFDNLGASVANVLVNGIRNAIDTVSYGLWQVIDGTATWGDLFRQVGRQIISDLIRIAIQEILLDNLKRGLMMAWKGFISMFRAADVAEANAAEAAKAPALATNATLASIGSWGLAVAIGVAAIAGIMASLGAFEKGGVVRGGEQIIRVNESGTESVLNASATARLGEGAINALNAGAALEDLQSRIAMNVMPPSETMPSYSGGRSHPSPAAPMAESEPKTTQLTLVIVDSKATALEAVQSAAGRAFVIETVRGAKTEIGIPT